MVRLFWSGFLFGHDMVVIATTEPLSVAIPQELYRLAASKPALLNPVLKKLATVQTADAHSSPFSPEELQTKTKRASVRRLLLELAAHDLRNPLSGVLTACQFLIEDAGQRLEPQQSLVLYSIESSARTALQLIQRLEEISLVRLNQPELEVRQTNLLAVVQQTVLGLRWLIDATKVKVDITAQELPSRFFGDPVRLREAFHGLIVNAIGSSQWPRSLEIVVGPRPGAATVSIHRDYAPAGHASGSESESGIPSGSTHRNLSDIHTALLLTRTRRILKAHGAKLQMETHGKRRRSWIVLLPLAVNQGAHGD